MSSSTSVPDSGIFEELNGMTHRHPSVRLASSRGQRVQSSVPVHTESSDGPAAMDNSPRVSLAPNRYCLFCKNPFGVDSFISLFSCYQQVP